MPKATVKTRTVEKTVTTEEREVVLALSVEEAKCLRAIVGEVHCGGISGERLKKLLPNIRSCEARKRIYYAARSIRNVLQDCGFRTDIVWYGLARVGDSIE